MVNYSIVDMDITMIKYIDHPYALLDDQLRIICYANKFEDLFDIKVHKIITLIDIYKYFDIPIDHNTILKKIRDNDVVNESSVYNKNKYTITTMDIKNELSTIVIIEKINFNAKDQVSTNIHDIKNKLGFVICKLQIHNQICGDQDDIKQMIDSCNFINDQVDQISDHVKSLKI